MEVSRPSPPTVMEPVRCDSALSISSNHIDFTQLSDSAEDPVGEPVQVCRRVHRISDPAAYTSYVDASPPEVDVVVFPDSVEPVLLLSPDEEPCSPMSIKSADLSAAAHQTSAYLGSIVCQSIEPVARKQADEEQMFKLSFRAKEHKWDIVASAHNLRSLPHAVDRSVSVAQIVKALRLKKLKELHHEMKQFNQWDGMDQPSKESFLPRVQEILNWFLADKRFSVSKPIMVFIQVSWLSFGESRSAKLREGYIYKERGGRAYRKGGCLNMCRCLGSCLKQKRWMMILDDAVCYADSNDPKMQLRAVLWFDPKFKVLAGLQDTGSANGLIVSNLARTLRTEVKGGEREAMQWKEAIEEAAANARGSERYRFNSFAPEHEGAEVQLLIDGQPYFHALYDALERATTSIYMTDWWLTPTILLRRCGTSDDSLVAILRRKAEQGVIVRITLYREIESFLYTCSKNAAQVLSDAHKNIQVQRHPEHGLVSLGENRGVLFWSHHEKLVCIDAETCFIGGLDLCLGRYDNHHHVLQDNNPDRIVFPGKDYSNPVVKDFYDVINVDQDILCRESDPRMPWHDVHCMVVSKPFARDMAKHFMQLWNHILTDRNKPAEHNYLVLPTQADVKNVMGRPANPSRTQQILNRFLHSDRPSEVKPATPSNRIKAKKKLQGAVRLIGLRKKLGGNVGGIEMPPVHGKTPKFENCTVQFCRSSCEWSNGTGTNSSIHSAYVTLIQNAQNYVYIENQFFVTCTHRGQNALCIKNRIGEALASKIEEKHARNEPFKVYVVMPLMPAFEAEAFSAEEAWQCRQTMYAQYMSIIDSPDSVIGALQVSLTSPNSWEDYIVFCCLRQVASTPDGVIHPTQIYIHSKCCIVDDEHVIIGSANINDRSMLGTRDSEVAVVVSDPTFATSTRMRLWSEHFNVIIGDQNTAEERISAMSRKQNLSDPMSKVCWQLWITTAMRNDALLYEKLHAWPCSRILSWEDYHACVARRNAQLSEFTTEDWNKLLAQVLEVTHGARIVMFPLFFLNNEDMRFPRPVSAKLASNRIFT